MEAQNSNSPKKITRSQFIELMMSQKGATFSGMTYFVDESKSRTKNGRKMIQKQVTLNATLNSVYKSKINRILEKHQIEIDWTPNKMTGRSYVPGDKNHCMVAKDKNPNVFYLAFVSERHTKPQTTYFRNGQPVSREDIWNETYITPAGLRQNDKAAVQNSMFNHTIKAANDAENAGETERANNLRETANKLANIEEFKELEFMFRTVEVNNLIAVNLGGEKYLIED